VDLHCVVRDDKLSHPLLQVSVAGLKLLDGDGGLEGYNLVVALDPLPCHPFGRGAERVCVQQHVTVATTFRDKQPTAYVAEFCKRSATELHADVLHMDHSVLTAAGCYRHRLTLALSEGDVEPIRLLDDVASSSLDLVDDGLVVGEVVHAVHGVAPFKSEKKENK